jgi:hypothetical protein
VSRRPIRADVSDPAHDPLSEGLIDEPEPEPTRTARTRQDGPYHPSREDESWYVQASARGLFRPLPPSHPAVFYPGKGKPPGRRAKAVKNWTDAGCPDVPPK